MFVCLFVCGHTESRRRRASVAEAQADGNFGLAIGQFRALVDSWRASKLAEANLDRHGGENLARKAKSERKMTAAAAARIMSERVK